MPKTFLFCSESVSDGHPDKLCDQISDAILDACLTHDTESKVALETAAKGNTIGLYGEITTTTKVDYIGEVRNVLKKVGYNDVSWGCDWKSVFVHCNIMQQEAEIASVVHRNETQETIGAGDQGFMMGYATDETEEMMPLSHVLCTQLLIKLKEVRQTELTWVRPDAKSQAIVEYFEDENGHIHPKRIHTLLISTQHQPGISRDVLETKIRDLVMRPVVAKYHNASQFENINILINPKQKISNVEWTVGGPLADAGVTGRKIIVDTYGGWGGHGGGAFSGKDPSKVDRSACYAARWVAKSLVAAKIAKRVLIQVSYVIGEARPLSIHVNSFGTGIYPDEKLLKIVEKNFDLRPGVIVRELNLKRPIYLKTAAYGHFGRNDPEFTWETPKQLKVHEN